MTFEQFEQELLEALNHLYDPDYRPSEQLCELLGCSGLEGGGAAQTELLAILRNLEPKEAQSAGGRPRVTYDVLHSRYVLKLTQEQTAYALHVSLRTARREQRRAVHALAQVIWENRLAQEASADSEGQHDGGTAQARDRQSQLYQDLEALRASSSLRVSDVAQTLTALLPIARPMAASHGCSLSVESPREGLVVALHPSALRQVMILGVAKLAESAQGGALSICARADHHDVLITMQSACRAGSEALEPGLIREIIANEGGSVETERTAGNQRFCIRLPWIGTVKVLVVDDNPDVVSYYERCTVGTRYRIAHMHQVDALAEATAEMAPDVILLDIMLPGLDGWDLLTQLQAAPATRDIPIVVCSVVAQADLATMLGAVRCLPKPVQRQALLEALDQALAGDPAPGPPSTAPSKGSPSA